ncbi:MAG: hypothetical protein U5N55_12800 [Cypionkella sp.]|nr:hypothetical protein [Cypionkella sp.]
MTDTSQFDLLRALRDPAYLSQVSDKVGGYCLYEATLDAADEIERLRAKIAAMQSAAPKVSLLLDVDALAQIIRAVDGRHDLGAGELAARILGAL